MKTTNRAAKPSATESRGFSHTDANRERAASTLADCAADKLERLAADLTAVAALPYTARTPDLTPSYVEAGGALARLAVACLLTTPPQDGAGAEADRQAQDLHDHVEPVALFRRWAAAWRAFSSGAS